MSPGSNTVSYPAFAHIGLRENPRKNLNQATRRGTYSAAYGPDSGDPIQPVYAMAGFFTSREGTVSNFPGLSEYQYYFSSCIYNRLSELETQVDIPEKKEHLLRTSGKELKKRLMQCFVWSVALYWGRTWTLRRSEEKQIGAFEIVGEERKKDAEPDQEEEKELVRSLAEKKLPTGRCTGRNGEREKSSGQKKISSDRRN
ncbi:hypothetical protein ANN_07542 [Periplaneta americana]|uniref:Uncharacterized protein n=1 Tax=Periplaneta americana TaxID=6978 RepID=A0ABQ8SZJ4_PERAM|nr:hypothetical protein ANN_07542 [Periplaneta americana]